MHKLDKCSTEDEVYECTITAAKDILNFNSSSILIYDGECLVIKKSSSNCLDEGTRNPPERGICGKTFRESRSFLVEDVRDWGDAKPASEEYRSAISVPIGDLGVFQVISNEVGFFDENDMVLVEILASHAFEAIMRIRYENELKEKEELYRTLFENSGTAIAIIEDDMTASMVNKKVEELTGYTRDELIGSKKWTEFVVEDDVKEMIRLHKLRREQPESTPFNYTFQFINRYGDTRDMLVNITMIPGTKKSLISLLDITYNLKTLRAFEESQEMFRIAFENASHSIVIMDVEGGIMEVNDAFCNLTGYDESDLADKKINELFSEEDSERCKKEFEEITAGKRKMCKAQLDIIDKEGKEVRSQINVSPVKDSDGNIRILLAFIAKITSEEGAT